GRILRRIAERLALHLPVALPSQHTVSRNLKPRERCAHEGRDNPQILGQDLRVSLGENAKDLFSQPQLLQLLGWREEGLAAVSRPPVRPVEPAEMVDAMA